MANGLITHTLAVVAYTSAFMLQALVAFVHCSALALMTISQTNYHDYIENSLS